MSKQHVLILGLKIEGVPFISATTEKPIEVGQEIDFNKQTYKVVKADEVVK